MIKVRNFFTPKDTFENDEWILKRQIFALRVISFFFGLGVFSFSYIRLQEGNLIVGLSQLFLGIFLLFGFYKLNKNKSFYHFYSIWFMILLFAYTTIIFFFVPQNHLNILWVVSAPILIFFFLNRKGGVIMFIWVGIFILYLIFSGYPYIFAEFVTLISAFLVTTFVMYVYERVKDSEKDRLVIYSNMLQKEVEVKTKDLQNLNKQLEYRIKEEVGQRLAQEQMLLRQSRMASMGEMIDTIAHQWRQPLMNINAVMMNLDRGIERAKKPSELKEKVLEIFSLTAHMSHTIEDFRDLLKIGKDRHYFILNDVIVGVVKLLKNNLKGIVVGYEVDEEIGIESYQSEFTQVLIILLNNASEILHLRNISDKHIYISIREEYQGIFIEIEDNAGGIDKEDLAKIFDPYYTTKNQIGGTGLGLYIARIIIEKNMNGSIVASNTDRGALFSIGIPTIK